MVAISSNLVKRIDKFTQETLRTSNEVWLDGTAYDVLGGVVYFSIKPNRIGGKYCFVYCSTHKIAKAFKTQKEVEMFLSEHGF